MVRPERVRMDDIARRVGVSRTTVSFVLNDRPNVSVSDATRAQIREVAAAMGYRPHAGARALAAKRSGLLGMITEIVTSPFGPEAVTGAQDQAWREGKFLLLAASEGNPDLERQAIDRLLEQRVDGIILATSQHVAISLPVTLRDVPTVIIHGTDSSGYAPSIVPDEEGGGAQAAQRLIEAGHRRIGMVNIEQERPAARGRLAGFRRALEAAGLEADPKLVVHTNGTADDGYEAAARILGTPNPPTALFCATDRMAMGAYDLIKERGLRIPDDVAVVGFDDQQLIAAFLRPKLTTISLPFREMASRAVTLIGEMVEGREVPKRTVVACPLVERASV